jgi:hypothetical protein
LVLGVNLGGAALNVGDDVFISHAQALQQGMVVHDGTNATYPISVPLTPQADAATQAMLESFVWRRSPPNGEGFSIDMPLANGTYHVSFWSLENYRDHYRAMAIWAEGRLLQGGLFDLPVWNWQEAGPYDIQVDDGVLNLSVLRDGKGDPFLTGFAVRHLGHDVGTALRACVLTPTVVLREGGAGEVVRLGLNHSDTVAQVFQLVHSGTAVAGLDFSGTPAQVTIPPGAVETTFTLMAVDDALVEGPETATVTLQSVGNTSVMPSVITVHVQDNDSSLPATLVILPTGDSNTAGVGNPPVSGSTIDYTVTVGYRKKLKELLALQGITSDMRGSQTAGQAVFDDPQHEGYPGRGIQRIRERVAQGMLEAYEPHVMTLLIGSNDMWVSVSSDRSPVSDAVALARVADFASLMDEVHQRRPEMHVIVGKPATPTNALRPLGLYRDGIQDVVDARQALGWKVSTVDFMGLANDGTHYRPDGFEQMAAIWKNEILRIHGP